MHSIDEKTLHRHQRIRRVKKWLRFLPRKATLHRYPLLKYFAKSMRKRAYLWSFRVKDVAPAFYAGWILTLLPGFGFHTIMALVLSFLLKTNIMILVGLQAIANPLIVAPIWAFEYYVGKSLLKIFHCKDLFLESAQNTGIHFGHHGTVALNIFLTISVGAIFCGIFFAFLSMLVYKIVAKRVSKELKHGIFS